MSQIAHCLPTSVQPYAAEERDEVIFIAEKRRHIIRNRKAIKLLSVPERARLLRPFLTAPHTVATAAEALGLQPSSMTYWVKTFLHYGLIQDSTTLVGRVGKVYQATADEFILLPGPGYLASELHDLESARTQEYLAAHLKLAAERASPYWAVRVYLDDLGYLRRDDIPVTAIHDPSPSQPYGVDRFMEVRLSEADYQRLQVEMEALMDRYLRVSRTDQDSAEVKRALIFMALVHHQGEVDC